jgi:hypothetical protein
LLYVTEHIRRLNTLKVAMIAFASLVVVTDLPQNKATVEERIFEIVPRRWNRSGHTPDRHLYDPTVRIVNTLMEQ